MLECSICLVVYRLSIICKLPCYLSGGVLVFGFSRVCVADLISKSHLLHFNGVLIFCRFYGQKQQSFISRSEGSELM